MHRDLSGEGEALPTRLSSGMSDGDKVRRARFSSKLPGESEAKPTRFRSQIEMWMLTKFAMIFFIMALFVIIFVFEQNERSNICNSQAQNIARGIENRISQILDSPVEDEQRSFVFEIGLPLGRDDLTRYFVNLTKQEEKGKENSGRLIIDVYPAGLRSCLGGTSVVYSDKEVKLYSPRWLEYEDSRYKREVIQLSPSDPDEDTRSYYLVAIKCGGKKTYPPSNYLFVQDCAHKDPNSCMSFNTADVDLKCGFP